MKKQRDFESCREADAVAWTTGQLEGDEASCFAHHLDECEVCRAEVAALKATVARLRAAPLAQPSVGLAAKIMAAVADERRLQQRRVADYWKITAAAAALVLAAGLLLHYLCQIPHHMEPLSVASDHDQQREEALDWLAAQQECDGSWSPLRSGGNEAYRPAVTALALLALQSGDTALYGENIRRATAALMAMQQADGSFCQTSGAQLYNHAFATYALLHLPPEQLKQSGLHAVCSRAIAFARERQTSDGAWDYSGAEGGNTALTSWQLAVLTRARGLGWSDDGGHLRRGLAWLRSRNDGQAFGYRQPGVVLAGQGGLTLTAMAASSLIEGAGLYPVLLNDAIAAVGMLQQLSATEQELKEADFYRDYFLARVSALLDDQPAQQKISTRVAASCSIRPEGDKMHWLGRDRWGGSGGDIYATSMALLSCKRL